jgi:DNA-binding transcriptional ArsR family regulator
MVRDPRARDELDTEVVLDALDDADARAIIRALEEPMTASELSDACDIPLSTTYRKLDLLTEASLLLEGTEVRSDGHHTTRYEVAFEEVRIGLDEERRFEIAVEQRDRSAEERLADMWSQVRRET